MPKPLPVELLERMNKRLPGFFNFVDECRHDEKVGGFLAQAPFAFAQNFLAETWCEAKKIQLESAQIYLATALASWRPTQGIFRFDDTVREQLLLTPIDGDFPAECLLRMPEWCVYIETPGLEDYLGFFAYLAPGKKEHMVFLLLMEEHARFCAFDHDRSYGVTPLAYTVNGEMLFGDLSKFEEKDRTWLGEQVRHWDSIARKSISLLAYLCSEDAEVRPTRGRGKITPVAKPQKNGPPRMPPARSLEVWETGFRLGAQLREAVAREKEGNGGTVRPHVRRAHWHTYLKGKGRSERVLKWTHPILVVGGPDRATIRNVKEES